MDLRERSDLQLLRVSKGAHELRKMIDYWSKSSNSNGQQNLNCSDLLRRALELQDSLLTLSRLQKASIKNSLKKMRQTEREEFPEEISIDRSKRLHEHSLSDEMKHVIRDKINKFDNENLSLTSKVEFSAQAKKKKAPNLIAKLMGLEDLPLDDQIEAANEEKVLRRSKSHAAKSKSLDEIIEIMRSTGFLKTEQSVNLMANSDLRFGANFSQKDKIPPIVIMKSINSQFGEREEIDPISETSDLILDDRVSEFSENLEQSEVMRIEEEKIEEPQKLKIAAAASQKQLKRDSVLKERRMIADLKKIEINGKKQVEQKKLKAVRESKNMNSTESSKAKKLQATGKLTSQTNKSNEQSKKDKFLMKSASFKSLSSVGKEKISSGRQIRKINKPEDSKSKDGISKCESILAADSLLKQAQKEPKRPFEKDEIKIGIICEGMPRSHQSGRSFEMFEPPH